MLKLFTFSILEEKGYNYFKFRFESTKMSCVLQKFHYHLTGKEAMFWLCNLAAHKFGLSMPKRM